MVATHPSRSAELHRRLDHPVIDADGHYQELPPVLQAYLLDYVRQYGGADLYHRLAAAGDLTFNRQVVHQWYRMSPEERLAENVPCPPWWFLPARNTRDRATAHLPRLLYERLGEMGIDFSVLYPSQGLTLSTLADAEMRRVVCRAFNAFQAELFRPYADRLTPAATIPMHTPEEAIAELEYAVNVLGLKTIVIAHVLRPIPSVARDHPAAAAHALRLDTFGVDSEYNYDPFWAKCVELKVSVGTHGSGQGWGSRRSPSRYVYNHIGAFGAAGEALCKSLFMGGVTRRFPTLKFAFLEGGVSWACALYADLIAHWEKRNARALAELDPAALDQQALLQLVAEYGEPPITAHLEALRAVFAEPQPHPTELDDFAACGIQRAEDIRDLFVPNFYFGCEADDPINAWAFNPRVNPFGARLQAILGSDISHWDVTDMSSVLAEAYELLEDGLLTETDFRDFVFANAARFYAESNPDFFKGTACETAVARLFAEKR